MSTTIINAAIYINRLMCAPPGLIPGVDKNTVFLELAMQALNEKAERENPAPLTLEELRQMDGEPVWIVWPDGRIESKWWIVGNYDWHMMEFNDDTSMKRYYGKTWNAYRHKPEEVQE